jgi:hypothetical protein
MEMPGGVLIPRIVTATDMSTGETEAQVYPRIPNSQAILTPIGARRDVLYLIKMRASLCHVLFLLDACVRLGPALLIPPGDAGDTLFWSQPWHLGTYDSSDSRLSLHVYLITSLGTLLHSQRGLDVLLS